MKFIIPKSWNRGFEVAKAASLLSNSPTVSKKMGAALFNRNNLISIGYNIYDKTHPLYVGRDKQGIDFCYNTHAELMAITRRRHYNNGSLILYVYRETQNGELACSRPCKICSKVIKEFGVKRVRFIDEQGQFIEEKI